jgi:carbonic anhydrase/acetyltransferase-like protein (isoleucine patch superfamily)
MLYRFGQREPKIAEDVFLASNSIIIGDCEIRQRASIWFGTIIRADVNRIIIGEMTNIQDLTVIHVDEGQPPVIIGNRVSVGHRAILHGCQIEDECMIGMGAILLNRVKVGKNTIVAAGSVLLEDYVAPPGTLIAGVPAQVKREIKSEEIEWIRKVAEGYYRLAKQYQNAI